MTDPHNPILSSGDDDATRAYLFQASGNPSIHAVTRDALGSNLPTQDSGGDWILDREFALGVREVMPINVAPEPILRGLEAHGYFVWADHSNPKVLRNRRGNRLAEKLSIELGTHGLVVRLWAERRVTTGHKGDGGRS